MKIIIIIPTYNEKGNIEALVNTIFSLQIPGLEILIVDDNSPDKTAELVENLQSQYPGLHILKRPSKLGLGSAYIAGFKWAKANQADLVFEMDADFSHNPQDIPKLIQPIIRQKADLVIGSRRIKNGHITGWNFYRHVMSWGAMTLARLVLRLKTRDVTAGFRCYKASVLQTIDLDKIKSNGYAFQEEMIWLVEKLGFTVTEVPITFKDRDMGESKLSGKDIKEFFATLLKLIFTNPNKYRVNSKLDSTF